MRDRPTPDPYSSLTFTLRNSCSVLGLSLAAMALAACGGHGSDTPSTFSIGGTISGLTVGGLVLANGTETVSAAANVTAFTLPTSAVSGTSYAIVL